jgi:hypothetical protein
MTFGALVKLLIETPELLAQLLAALVALLVAIGGIGSALEQLGTTLGWPRLVAIGQRLEAIGTDGPKAIRGSRLTAYQTKAIENWGVGPKSVLLVLVFAAALLPNVTACASTPADKGRAIKAAVVDGPRVACAALALDPRIPRDSETDAACAALRECAGQ